MLFFHPMWDSESERIGLQKCTPAGYRLHAFAELIGLLGGFMLLALLGYLWFTDGFNTSRLWYLALPLGFGAVSEIMVQYSWLMARRLGWQYDGHKREASWIENGQRRTFSWQQAHDESRAP